MHCKKIIFLLFFFISINSFGQAPVVVGRNICTLPQLNSPDNSDWMLIQDSTCTGNTTYKILLSDLVTFFGSGGGASGTVTNVATSLPLLGGTITTTGTLSVDTTDRAAALATHFDLNNTDSIGTIVKGVWTATAIDSTYLNVPSRVIANFPFSFTIEGKTYKLVADTTTKDAALATNYKVRTTDSVGTLIHGAIGSGFTRIDTAYTKAVSKIYRVPGTDSVYYYIGTGEPIFGFRDSIGSGGGGSVDTTVIATRDYAENLIIDSLHTTVTSKVAANSPLTSTKEGKSYKLALDTTIMATRDYAENLTFSASVDTTIISTRDYAENLINNIDTSKTNAASRVTANLPLSITIEGKTYKIVADTSSRDAALATNYKIRTTDSVGTLVSGAIGSGFTAIDTARTNAASRVTALSPLSVTIEGKTYKLVLDTTVMATRDFAENLATGGTPGGSDGSVQFNNDDVMTGDANFIYHPFEEFRINMTDGNVLEIDDDNNEVVLGDVDLLEGAIYIKWTDGADSLSLEGRYTAINSDSVRINSVRNGNGTNRVVQATNTGKLFSSNDMNGGSVPFTDANGKLTTSNNFIFDDAGAQGYSMGWSGVEPIFFATPTLQVGVGQVLNVTYPDYQGWYLFAYDDPGAARSHSIEEVCLGTRWMNADSILLGDWITMGGEQHYAPGDSNNYIYILDSIGKMGSHASHSYWLSTDIMYLGDSARADTATRIVLYDTLGVSYIRIDANEMYLGQDTINGPFLHLNKATSHTHLRGPEIRIESQNGHVELQTDSVIFENLDGTNSRILYIDDDELASVNDNFSYDPSAEFKVGSPGFPSGLFYASFSAADAWIGDYSGENNGTAIYVNDDDKFIKIVADSIMCTDFAGTGTRPLAAIGSTGRIEPTTIYTLADTTIFSTRDYAENQGGGSNGTSGRVQVSGGSGTFTSFANFEYTSGTFKATTTTYPNGGFRANDATAEWTIGDKDGDVNNNYLVVDDANSIIGLYAAAVNILPAAGTNTGVVTADASGNISRINPGSSGNILQSNGTTFASIAVPTWNQNTTGTAAGLSVDLAYSSLTQGSALSVLGVTGNATADVASIAAGSDHQVLRRSGTSLGFGALNLASSNAVTGILPAANVGAAGSAGSIPINMGSGIYGADPYFNFSGSVLYVGNATYDPFFTVDAASGIITIGSASAGNQTNITLDDGSDYISMTPLQGTGRAEVITSAGGQITRGRQVIELVLSQTGTSNPTVNLEINGTGETLTVTREGAVGQYKITASGSIFDSYTGVFFSGSTYARPTIFQYEVISATEITITTIDITTQSEADDSFDRTNVMIRF